MTYDQAVRELPADAEWSCSFGNPGDYWCQQIWRTTDGRRWTITKKLYASDDEWSVGAPVKDWVMPKA